MSKRARFVAVCPDCEAHRDLDAMPEPGWGWPRCDDCMESMNVYTRTLKEPAKL